MTETERVYLQLKKDVLSGRYSPGEALRQEDIATQLGASRTPVREAIIMLAADRLVSMEARHGATVKGVSVRDFIEINQVRELLEGAAAKAAAKRVPEAEIRELRALHEAVQNDHDADALIELDQRIHRTFAGHCGNRQMQRLIEEFNDLNTLARQRDVEARDAETLRSLGGILDALETRDADKLESLMRAHIQEFAWLLPEP